MHGMTVVDFGRLLDLEPSMGGKILKGTRPLTVSPIQKLAKHFAMQAGVYSFGGNACDGMNTSRAKD